MSEPLPSSSPSIANVFEQEFDWLCARLRRYLGCAHNAEDVASETFLKLLGMPESTTIREPRALLTTIAKRLMHESWRRRDLERAYLQLMQSAAEHTYPSPEETHLIVETLVRLDKLLDSLPGQGKAAFIHSQIGGLTYAQIAERLNLSESRVQQYMIEAFKLCYRALHE